MPADRERLEAAGGVPDEFQERQTDSGRGPFVGDLEFDAVPRKFLNDLFGVPAARREPVEPVIPLVGNRPGIGIEFAEVETVIILPGLPGRVVKIILGISCDRSINEPASQPRLFVLLVRGEKRIFIRIEKRIECRGLHVILVRRSLGGLPPVQNGGLVEIELVDVRADPDPPRLPRRVALIVNAAQIVVEIDLRRGGHGNQLIRNPADDPVLAVLILRRDVGPLGPQLFIKFLFVFTAEVISQPGTGNQLGIFTFLQSVRSGDVRVIRFPARRADEVVITADLHEVGRYERCISRSGRRIRRLVLVIHQGNRHAADRRLCKHLRLTAAAVVVRDLLRQQRIRHKRQSHDEQQRENPESKQQGNTALIPFIYSSLFHSRSILLFFDVHS